MIDHELMNRLKKEIMAEVATYPNNKQFDLRLVKPDTYPNPPAK